MSEISNKKKKFIKRNFKQLSIEELAHKTGLKLHVIRSFIDEYTTEMTGKDQDYSKKLTSYKGSHKNRSMQLIVMGTIVIFLLIFMVHTPALKNDFVNWDDETYIYGNTNIQSLNFQAFYWMLTSFYATNWHPLTWLSHAIDYAFWGLNPFGHHLTNIILHGLNSLLVFLLAIQLILRAKKVSGKSSPPKMPLSISTNSLVVAGITALLFGLHPLHVESVAWVSERKDILCSFFFLLSILSYLSYTSSVVTRHRWMWFAAALLLFVFALMSKPMAVSLPVILLLLDICPLKRITLKSDRKLSVLLEKIPFFSLSIISGIITIIAQHSGGAIRSLERMPLSIRLVNGLHSLLLYLEKMIWPHKLIPFYPLSKHIYHFDPEYIIPVILVLAITGICLWMVKKGNYLLFIVWSYYVITLIPVLGIIQVGDQAAADRYTYLPSLSIFLLIGIGISWVFERRVLIKHKGMFRGLVLAFICILMFLSQLTVKQIKIWRNSEILWSYVINFSPGRIPLAHNNLGYAYAKKGELDKAISEYKRALILKPHYVTAHSNLGNVYLKKSEFDKAISEYKQVLAINPNDPDVHNNLGNVYLKKSEFDKAISEYKQVLAINPNDPEVHNNLGLAYYNKGMYDKAILEYKKALSINSNLEKVHYNFGLLYEKKGVLDRAISEYKRELAINPNNVGAHNNLGRSYYNKGRLDEAIYEFKQALAIKPRFPMAHNNLAVAYYSKGNYKLAIIHCDKTIELGHKIHPQFLSRLEPYR